MACFKCFEKRIPKCALDEDLMNNCIDNMSEAEGLILESPTYR
ncbi:MAG: hypothetical protein LUQ38_10565 [Methanotrichaceae archaeon]|nr:hypothetical protein [Methanotrichaceae archaeon]MDD1757420.1 hypothetical protein [Methanotrichaceae archaeon]